MSVRSSGSRSSVFDRGWHLRVNRGAKIKLETLPLAYSISLANKYKKQIITSRFLSIYQVVGILVGVSIVVLVTSPLLLLASPCILCCICKPCGAQKKKKKKKRKKDLSRPDSSTS